MMDQRPPPIYSQVPPPRIFVLEDDDELRIGVLLPALRSHGFRVQGAATAAEFYRLTMSQHFDIVVLNIGLPDDDGFAVAKHLRSISDIGIVMLTGHQGRQHHLRALKDGADFYLTKPIDLDLLAATLHSLARRVTSRQGSAIHDAIVDTPLKTDWRLTAGGWRLISPEGKVLAVTTTEQCVAVTLAAEMGLPVSRHVLIRALAENAHDFDTHRLEMMIHRWRRKALAHTGKALPLLTVRRNGYVLDCEIDVSVPTLQL